MTIPVAGILYILTVGWLFLKRKNLFANLFMLCVLSEFIFQRAYVIGFGESVITFELASQYILILYCALHLRGVSKKYVQAFTFLAFSYILPIVLLTVIPSSALVATPLTTWDMILGAGYSPVHPGVTGHAVMMTLKFLLFALVFIYIYQHWTKREYQWAVRWFCDACTVFLYIGLFEFIAKNFMGLNELWGDVVTGIFGARESTVGAGRLRGNLYELTLFTQEASHYAYMLMMIAIVKLADNIMQNKKHKLDITIILTLLLMALSTSFSAVYMAATFFCIYLAYRWQIQRPKYMKYEKLAFFSACIFAISSTSVFIAMNTDSQVLIRLINLYENFDKLLTIDYSYGSTMGDFSTQIRMVSMIQTIRAWLWRPLFGFAIGTIDAHSGTAMFLSGVGLFGLYAWYRFYFKVTPLYQQLQPKKALYVCFILLFLLVHLLTGSFRAFFGLTLFYVVVSYCFIFQKESVYIT